MKNSILIVLLLLANALFAQDNYPKPFKFNYKVNGVQKTNSIFQTSDFVQDSFWLGTQWGGHPKMLQALRMQGNQGTVTGNYIIPNLNTNFKLFYIWENKLPNYSRAFQYEPTLYIPLSDRGKFITKPNDAERSIFGFSHISGHIISPDSANNENYGRLILYKNAGYANSVVLEKSWLNNKYEYNDDSRNPDSENGKLWVFSINLRRLNKNQFKRSNTPVLAIRLPYKLVGSSTTGYIKFDTIPSTTINDAVLLKYTIGTETDTLGYYANRRPSLNDTTTEIIIYDDMLPDIAFWNAKGRQDITINAFFICDGDIDLNNPLLRNGGDGIDTLDIQVKYLGNTDVAVNYLRLMTSFSEKYFTGSKYTNMHSEMQSVIDTSENKGYEIYGVYGRDEMDVEYYSFQKHISTLFNTCFVSEGGGEEYPDHYQYFLNPHKHWTGTGGSMTNLQSSPFYQRNDNLFQGISDYYRMFSWRGYRGLYNDTLNSGYETDLMDTATWKKIRTIPQQEAYDYILNSFHDASAIMFCKELQIIKSYHINSKFLFSDKFWWANFYPIGNWAVKLYNGVYYPVTINSRPETGEEVRVNMWRTLLYGGKGMLFDARCDSLRHDSDNDSGGFLFNNQQTNAYETWDLDSLIFTDNSRIGGDFIPAIDSSMFIHKFINRDSVSHYLGVPKDRIFYGRKSPRIEMYYLHNWIRNIDSHLMNLRLVSAFSKGFRIWRLADTARFSDTIMNKYIKLDDRAIIFSGESSKTLVSDRGIKTRPIDRMSGGEPFYEPYDSSFFDITLHRYKDDEDLSSGSFVIAALNRRTDPLVYFTENPADKHMLFMTPSEYFVKCEVDMSKNPMRPNDPDYSNSIWKSYFWKRFGVRELSIHFALPQKVYNNGRYLRLKELGVDNYDNLGIWYSEPYYHRIDTAMPFDGTLVSKHLPGQGKMIECKINSVFDNSESPCNICDFINNFDDFNISLVAQPKEGNNCCYNIEFTNHGDCSSGVIPVKLISNNSEQIQLNNVSFDDENNSKILNTNYDISNAGTFSIGQLCVGESSEPVEFEIVFGDDIDGNFYGCDRKFKYVLNCQQDTVEVENCCDLFTVSSTYFPFPPPPATRTSCCTDITINNLAINSCIKSISLDRYGTGELMNFNSTIVEPIFSTIGNHSLTEICNPVASCLPGSNTLFSIERDLVFRGVDGEIICSQKVPIYYCCDIIQGPGGTAKSVLLDESHNSAEANQILLEILPNPNHGYAKLAIKSENEIKAKIKIVSLTGEMIKQFEEINIDPISFEIELNLSDINSGSYYLILESETGNNSIKFIKLK